MRWSHTSRPGQGCESGRSAWRNSGSLRSTNWRWHAHPSGGALMASCPLRDACSIRTGPQPDAMDLEREAGRASAGSDAAWQANAFIAFWLGEDDHEPN